MNTDDLSARLGLTLQGRPFLGNKRAAYRDAGVSPQTFDRALHGLPIRSDKQAELEEFIARHENAASDPAGLTPTTLGGFTDVELVDELARRIRQREDVRNHGSSAANDQAPGSGADVMQFPSAEALDPTLPDDVAARSETGKGSTQRARERQDEETEGP